MAGVIERIWDLTNLELTVNWTLKEFKSLVDTQISPAIETGIGKCCQWKIALYPKGSQDGAGNSVSVYLRKVSPSYAINLFYMFSVQTKTSLLYPTDYSNKFFPVDDSAGRGFNQLFPLTQLEVVLVDDSLTIRLKIKFENGLFFENENPLKNYSEDMYKLLKDGDYSDFTIIIDSKTINVHKNILSTRCNYFKTNFASGLEETKTNKLTIVDADYETIYSFILYLYTESIQVISVSSALKLLQVAHKYQVEKLVADLETIIIDNLKNENVIQSLIVSHRLDLIKLTEKGIYLIVNNGKLNLHQFPDFELLNSYGEQISLFKSIIEELFKKIQRE